MNTISLRARRIRFLASVRSVEEARIALEGGADIIDCKDPAAGALGALPCADIAEISRVVDGRVPVSATVGDRAISAHDLVDRVRATGDAGVDYIKIGFERAGPWRAATAELSKVDGLAQRLVAVMLADQGLDFAMIEACHAAGFAGLLLDTHDKSAGPLTACVRHEQVAQFVKNCRDRALFVGLAGSLRPAQIGPLVELEPDILGFRGALCAAHGRKNALCREKVAEIHSLINKAQTNVHFVRASHPVQGV